MIVHDSYRVSDRVVIRVGEQFRAKGGPYYIRRVDGGKPSRVSMSARGPFRFAAYCEHRGRKWIVAYSSRDGGYVVLSLTRRKSVLPGAIVARPYRVTGKVGKTRRQRAEVNC